MFFSGEIWNKIRHLLIALGYLSALAVFSQCEDEKANPRSYPRVADAEVTDITENGAVFRAEISSIGTEQVLQHGFVWGTSTTPTIYNSNKVLLGSASKPGPFRAEIHTTLRKTIKYYVKPFIQSAEHIVYGSSIVFVSLGSEAPVIEDFEPKTGRWLDTLVIRGRNFSYQPGENQVKLNEGLCNVLSATDSTLKVLVSTGLTNKEGVLSVSIADNIATFTDAKFNLILPIPEDFTPKLAKWGDTIKITGKYLYTSILDYSYTGKIGGFPFTFIEKKDDYFLVKVPDGVNLSVNIVEVKINGIDYQVPGILSLIPPAISGIRPKEGTWGTIITIIGKFHPKKERNLIKIGGFTAPIISFWKDSLTVAVPSTTATHNNTVINEVAPFSIVSPDNFTLYEPLLQTVSPMSGSSGTLVTITGKYLYNSTGITSVRFGSTEAVMVYLSSNILTCRVPDNMMNGLFNLTVTVKSQSTVYANPFLIEKNPYITGVSSLNATFNDEITITGENFILDASTGILSISGKNIPVKSITPTQIVFTVPTDLDSSRTQIKVTVGTRSITYSEKFLLLPPEFTTVTPSEFRPGDEIVITGFNFNPVSSNSTLFFGDRKLTISGISPTTITTTIPLGYSRGSARLKLNANGFKKSSGSIYNLRSPWLSLTVPNTYKWNSYASGTDYDNGYSFAINGSGYILYSDNNVVKFNPTLNSWTNLYTNTSAWKRSAAGVVVQDQFYIIYGTSFFQKYFPETNLWRLVAGCPVSDRYGVAFGLNNKIYFGLGLSSLSDNTGKQDFWECDISDNHKWTQKANFPGSSVIVMGGYFSIGSTGYALFQDNSLWAYNPDADSWTRKADFPGLQRTVCSAIVLNNKGLVGSGKKLPSVYFSDFWFYDPASDTWSEAPSIYNTRNNILSFSLNNKGYFGYGANSTSKFYDFFEYDPNYTFK